MPDHMLTTDELAQATGVAPELLLTLMDLGALRGHVRLAHGRPVFARSAVDAVRHAVEIGDQAAAGELSYEKAWDRVLKAAAAR
jgi:hypothetical protein